MSMSNLKQIGIAQFTYSAKNDGKLPCKRNPYVRLQSYGFWPGEVTKICGTTDILYYPGVTNPAKYRLYGAAGGLHGQNLKNGNLNDLIPRYVVRIYKPSETYLFFEAKMRGGESSKTRVTWSLAFNDLQRVSPEATKIIAFPFADINFNLRGDGSVNSLRFTSRGTLDQTSWQGIK